MKYRLKPSFGQKLWANVNGRMFIFYANRYESYPDNVVEFYADVLEPETAPKPKKAKPKPEPEPDPAAYTEILSNDC
jgi:hypothetical protein